MRKSTNLLPILAAATAIPHLLFWWFSPTDDNSLFIYIAGALITAALPAVYYITYLKSSLRETACVGIAAAALDVLSILVCALLLWRKASIRTAVFSLLLITTVSFIVLFPLVSSLLNQKAHGVSPVDKVRREHTAKPPAHQQSRPKSGRAENSPPPIPPRKR